MSLKKIICASILLLLCIGVKSQDQLSKEKAGINKASLQGGWTCILKYVDVHIAQIYPEGPTPNGQWSRPAVGNYVFENDSVWLFEYPCEMIFHVQATLEADTLTLHEPGKPAAVIILALRNDTLTMISENGASVARYKRDTFDPLTIRMLRSRVVNPECISGKWKLVTYQEVPGDNGFERTYPVQLPAMCTFSKNYLPQYLKKRSVLLPVQGKSREFHVDKINAHSGEMILSPAGWWKGAPFSAYYKQMRE